MKPKDLKKPEDIVNHSIYFEDIVCYLYAAIQDRQQSYIDFTNFFNNTNPVNCELCSGNGDWVIQQALENPDTNWIAVEKRFDRVRKIWSKTHNYHLSNLRIVCGYAETLFSYYVPPLSIDNIYVNFPDPWPKKRHHKHRLIQENFMEGVTQILKNSGRFSLVTDDQNFLDASIVIIQRFLQPIMQSPYYQKIDSFYGNSWFENLWRGKGKDIYLCEFSKWDIADLNS